MNTSMSPHQVRLEGDAARHEVRRIWPNATSTYTGATSAEVYDPASAKVLGRAEADELSVEHAWIAASAALVPAGR